MSKRTLHCSFCDKSEHEVLKLLAGGTAFICNGCVDEANAIIKPAPDLTDLKAALEGLREAWPECWALRNNGAPMDPEVRAVADTLLIGERAGLLTKDKPVAGLVPLAECSPGLFLFGDCLGFLSEYGDPYVVSTGEAFWGGTSTKEARASLMVKPHTAANKPGDAMEKLISEIDGDFAIARSCYDFVPNSTNNAISDALGIMQKRVRSALQRAKGGGA